MRVFYCGCNILVLRPKAVIQTEASRNDRGPKISPSAPFPTIPMQFKFLQREYSAIAIKQKTLIQNSKKNRDPANQPLAHLVQATAERTEWQLYSSTTQFSGQPNYCPAASSGPPLLLMQSSARPPVPTPTISCSTPGTSSTDCTTKSGHGEPSGSCLPEALTQIVAASPALMPPCTSQLRLSPTCTASSGRQFASWQALQQLNTEDVGKRMVQFITVSRFPRHK